MCVVFVSVFVSVLLVCVCVSVCEQPFPLGRAAESFQSQSFPGRRTDHGNRSEGCLLESPFVPFSIKINK